VAEPANALRDGLRRSIGGKDVAGGETGGDGSGGGARTTPDLEYPHRRREVERIHDRREAG